jgi:hypothetical protein
MWILSAWLSNSETSPVQSHMQSLSCTKPTCACFCCSFTHLIFEPLKDSRTEFPIPSELGLFPYLIPTCCCLGSLNPGSPSKLRGFLSCKPSSTKLQARHSVPCLSCCVGTQDPLSPLARGGLSFSITSYTRAFSSH